jgi:hypothetical protein
MCSPPIHLVHARFNRSIAGRSPRALPLMGARGHCAMPGSMPNV